MEQIKSLSVNFKGRVLFNSTQKPYISVKLLPKEKTPDLMKKVIDIMSNSNEIHEDL